MSAVLKCRRWTFRFQDSTIPFEHSSAVSNVGILFGGFMLWKLKTFLKVGYKISWYYILLQQHTLFNQKTYKTSFTSSQEVVKPFWHSMKMIRWWYFSLIHWYISDQIICFCVSLFSWVSPWKCTLSATEILQPSLRRYLVVQLLSF